MFLLGSVILSTGGGGALYDVTSCLVDGGFCPVGVSVQGVSLLSGSLSGGGICPGGSLTGAC